MMHYGNGWFMGGWIWIFLIALVVVVVLVATSLLRSQGPGGRTPQRSPEDILKERYARGEIDHEEFRRRMDELRR